MTLLDVDTSPLGLTLVFSSPNEIISKPFGLMSSFNTGYLFYAFHPTEAK